MIKKIITSSLAACALIVLLIAQTVFAAGTATENITAPSSVINGNNVTIVVSVSNIVGPGGGVVSNYQGSFVYDPAYFNFVSFSSNAPFNISYNSTSGIVGGFDMTGGANSISGTSSNLYTLVLQAKQVGTTTVSTSNGAMGDLNADKLTLTAATPRTINITAAPTLSSNNFLSALSVSGYTISPTFEKNTTSYTLTVPNSASSVTINATKEDASASVTGTGSKALNVGSNTANIVVTAEDGSQRTYTINIVREAATPPPPTQSSDATLKSLSVSGYSLSPAFNKNTTNYTITVDPSIKGLDVTALVNDPKATVSITGNTGWDSSTNNITIKVTAEDGTVKNYIVTVKRPGDTGSKSSNNFLKELNVKDSPINFNKNTNSYSINVPYEVDKLDLSAITDNAKAKVEIIGNKDFKVGETNTVEIRVTAEDGSIRIYTINVIRSAAASKNKLANLEVKGHKISPSFDPNIETYSLKVPHSVTDLDVLYKTQDKDTKVEIIGSSDLKVGNNVIMVKVTDVNGFTRVYIINVERESATTILGMSPWLFFSLLGLLLFLLFFLIFLLSKRRKRENYTPPTPQPININVNPSFTPDVNIGSKNDSDFANENAKLIRGDSNETDNDNKIASAASATSRRLGQGTTNDRQNLDMLMTALSNRDVQTVKMFVKRVKAEDLQDELRGLDPNRYDDLFDDEVTVHEVVRAIEEWNETGDSKKLLMLMNQHDANQLEQKIKKRSNYSK